MEVTAHGLLQEWAHRNGYSTTITVPGDIYFHYDQFRGFAVIYFGNRPHEHQILRSNEGSFRLFIDSNPRVSNGRMIPYCQSIENVYNMTLADHQIFDKLSLMLEIHVMAYIEFLEYTKNRNFWPGQYSTVEMFNRIDRILADVRSRYGQA